MSILHTRLHIFCLLNSQNWPKLTIIYTNSVHFTLITWQLRPLGLFRAKKWTRKKKKIADTFCVFNVHLSCFLISHFWKKRKTHTYKHTTHLHTEIAKEREEKKREIWWEIGKEKCNEISTCLLSYSYTASFFTQRTCICTHSEREVRKTKLVMKSLLYSSIDCSLSSWKFLSIYEFK